MGNDDNDLSYVHFQLFQPAKKSDIRFCFPSESSDLATASSSPFRAFTSKLTSSFWSIRNPMVFCLFFDSF